MPLLQLPNGKVQVLDGNGDPLAGGSIFMYIPGTTTLKNTWKDPNTTTLNTNPIILDANGEAVIFGGGQYRQVVYDLNGNLLWDQITQGFWTGMNSDTTYLTAPYSTVGTISNSNGSLNYYTYQSYDLNWVRCYITAQVITNGTGSSAMIINLPFTSGVTCAWAGARLVGTAGVILFTIQQGSNQLQISDASGNYPGADNTSYYGMIDLPIQ